MLLVLFRKWVGKQEAEDASPRDRQSIEDKINQIRAGDHRLRNELISDYRPFIAKTASRCCKKYIDPEKDDEFSIALQAFDEALNQFRSESGGSFLGFAQTVIRRRLIDHIRKEQKHFNNLPLSSFDKEDDEQNVLNPVETMQALHQYDLDREAELRREEIMELDGRLSEFGITFMDLVKVSPKHADSRDMLFRIANKLVNDDELMTALLVKKQLPIKPLQQMCSVSRKTLERNRKYLIAVALIHSGSFPYLQQYLGPLKEVVEGD